MITKSDIHPNRKECALQNFGYFSNHLGYIEEHYAFGCPLLSSWLQFVRAPMPLHGYVHTNAIICNQQR